MIRRLLPLNGRPTGSVTHRGFHLGVIAVLAVALVVTGSGITFALWNASATATGTATTADLELTTSGFESSLTKTFGNHDLATTGSFTLTNTTETTSTLPGTYNATLSATGNATLAAKLAVAVWPIADPGACATATSTPGVVTGTWASFTAPLTGSLSAGEHTSYCIRVTATERGELASASGAMQIQPTVTANLSIGGWSDTATASTMQRTAWIYPMHGPQSTTWYQLRNGSTNQCVDVNAGAVNVSEWIIDFGCKSETTSSGYNQHWRFAATSGGYFEVIPRHAEALRLDVPGDPAPTTGGASTRIVERNSARIAQQWQLQSRGGANYQLVNRHSGLCLQPYETGKVANITEYAPMVCDGSNAQSFTLTSRGTYTPVANVDGLSCTSTANGVAYVWSDPAVGSYRFQARTGSSGTWRDLGTAASGATTLTIAGATNSNIAVGMANLRVRSASDTTLATGTVWKGQLTTGGTAVLQCAQPVAPLASLTCENSGNRNVAIGWAHPAVGAYEVDLLTVQGGWDGVATATQGSASIVISAESDWADQNRTLRVSFAGAEATIVVSKTRPGGNHTLRCLSGPNPDPGPGPDPSIPIMSCTGNGTNFIEFGWTEVSPDPANTIFRASIDGASVKSPDNPWWRTLQLYTNDSQPVTVAQFGIGPRTLLVEQRVGSGAWTAVGVRTIDIQAGSGAAGTNLLCG